MSSEHVVWCTKNTERKVQGCGIMTSVLDASKFLVLEVAERLSASLCSKINISKMKTDWQPPLTKKNLLPESVLFKAPSFVGHSSHFCSETNSHNKNNTRKSRQLLSNQPFKTIELYSAVIIGLIPRPSMGWSHSQTTDELVSFPDH